MIRPGMVLVAVVACLAWTVRADEPGVPAARSHIPPLRCTGNARIDFLGQTELHTSLPLLRQELEPETEIPFKSPWIASGLSLIVPGTGELYSESYWKSAAFFAVEIAAWVVAYNYDKKGDRQTNIFQDYADGHYSVVQYAQYAADNLAPQGQTYAWRIPSTQSWSPWDRPWDQINWPELNRMERDIGALQATSYYTHTLPVHGDQQYYELIGKYPQYNQGWDDANIAPGSYVYGDKNVTAHFAYYAGQRGQANTYYTTASTFVTVAVANHIVSSIDAFFTAKAHNTVHARVGTRLMSDGMTVAQVPVLTFSYGF